jgi:hypothetical protein
MSLSEVQIARVREYRDRRPCRMEKSLTFRAQYGLPGPAPIIEPQGSRWRADGVLERKAYRST